MRGALHDEFGDFRRRFDAVDGADGTGAAGGTVHDTGVEFDFAVFIWQTAVTHGGVIGIELNNVDAGDDGIERIASSLDDFHSFGAGRQAVGA